MTWSFDANHPRSRDWNEWARFNYVPIHGYRREEPQDGERVNFWMPDDLLVGLDARWSGYRGAITTEGSSPRFYVIEIWSSREQPGGLGRRRYPRKFKFKARSATMTKVDVGDPESIRLWLAAPEP